LTQPADPNVQPPLPALTARLEVVEANLAKYAQAMGLFAESMRVAALEIDAALQAYQAAQPAPFTCPISRLPWRSGLGNASDQLTAFAAWRNRGVGAVACWTAYERHCQDWAGLAGGPLDQPDRKEALLTKAGSYNLQRAAELCSVDTPLVWCVPLLPVALSNARRVDGSWGNPEVWARLIDPARDRAEAMLAWRLFGHRLAGWLLVKNRDPGTLTLDLGWEHSGHWFPWSCGPDHRSFKTYWRLVVDAIREGMLQADPARGDRLRFSYRIAGSTIAADTWRLEDTYPGNCWVDTIGRSAHEKDLSWASPAMWRMELDGTGPAAKRTKGGKLDGLQDALDFAVAHGKKLALTEWTVQRLAGGKDFPPSPDAAGAMRAMFSFIALNAAHLDHECYLLTRETSPLGEGGSWAGSIAYRQLWGQPA
jgi:hypothetical protein